MFLNQFNQAENAYFKCIELAAKEYQRATTLNNLANLQRAKNEFARAEKSYLEALEIYRKLAEANPQTYMPDLGMTLINMGIFYQSSLPDKGKYLQLLDEAISSLISFKETLSSKLFKGGLSSPEKLGN